MARLTDEERETVREQIRFVKEYRKLIHTGTFYRLLSPFEGNFTAWMVVSEDRKQAIVGYYKMLNDVNREFRRLRLRGLDEGLVYEIEEEQVKIGTFYGSELMNIGMVTTDMSAGEVPAGEEPCCDFWSRVVVLKAKNCG